MLMLMMLSSTLAIIHAIVLLAKEELTPGREMSTSRPPSAILTGKSASVVV